MPRLNQPFQFKHFSIDDSKCSMKVGTDSVLVGAWATVTGAKNILDIGSGSGLIALMLAQRTTHETFVDAVEIEEDAYQQALVNVKRSPWQARLKIHHSSIQNFKSEIKYDLIVTNPPFFIDSYKPTETKRANARHTQVLTHLELLNCVTQLLKPSGKFSLILPTAEGELFQTLALQLNLYIVRKTAFFSRKEKPQERWLMEFSFEAYPIQLDTLVLYHSGDSWSDEYRQLTKDFYLDK